MAKGLDSGGVLLVVLMAAAWAVLTFVFYDMVSSGMPGSGEERYSRGWEMLWAFALSLGVWVLLGILFYRLQLAGGMWVYGIGAAATVGAFYLFCDGEPSWPAGVVVALPAVLIGTSLSGHWGSLRLPVTILAAIPAVWAMGTLVFSIAHDRLGQSAANAETRRENLAVVATIGEDQPLWHWLPQLKEESGVREDTLAALRKLNRRQADVEAMLADDGFEAMELIPLLDLQPTPRLQELLNAWCAKTAEYARTKPGGGDEILERSFMYTEFPALHWIQSHGGDCREGIGQLKAAAMEYRDTKIRRKYIQELDGMLR